MISVDNKGTNHATSDADFTLDHYRDLLRSAQANYRIATYDQIPWGSRFVLWRHDVDFSLNRSLALARTEFDAGVRATYFLNPHSEFYNLAESSQLQIIKEIISLGHDIGLHFDAAYHGVSTESSLDELIASEAALLKRLYGENPTAVSFHNPSTDAFRCEADQYGGLTNCYSRRFKQEVAYCSDSNGYWRFRRLSDVLSSASDPCLQVLTHPGWWQDVPMPPRTRIFRCIYGRAAATMRLYDATVQEHGRMNHAGGSASLNFLRAAQPDSFELCDYLWNSGRYAQLFSELWRLSESQAIDVCRRFLATEWCVSSADLDAFLSEEGVRFDGWRLFNALFNDQWFDATGVPESEYLGWAKVHDLLVRGRRNVGAAELECGCVFLCELMQNLAVWVREKGIVADHPVGQASPSEGQRLSALNLQRWGKLKARFSVDS